MLVAWPHPGCQLGCWRSTCPSNKLTSPPPVVSCNQQPQEAVDSNKPSGAKGVYWKSLYVNTTMGPSLKVAVSQLQAVKSSRE